jgi:hypothetical protein
MKNVQLENGQTQFFTSGPARSMETILTVLLGRGAAVLQVQWDRAEENIQA